jgi:hypothetical protein
MFSPYIILALQEESWISLSSWEGPLGLVLCPSQELARQTVDAEKSLLLS